MAENHDQNTLPLEFDENDWALLDDERVAKTVKTAVKYIARAYGDVTDPDDITQEAVLLVAGHSALVREHMANPQMGERYLFTWLRSKLANRFETDARRSSKHVPLHAYREAQGE